MSHNFRVTSEFARQRLLAAVAKAPLPFDAELDEVRRTNEQNKKMQAMLTDIARQKPQGRVLTTDQWKCLFMDATAKETSNASFTSRWEPSLDGEGVVNTGFRSSRLNKSEMGDLISFIQAWGDGQGIVWSDQPQARAA